MEPLWKTFMRMMMLVCVAVLLCQGAGCASEDRPFTYYEYDGVFVYYKTDDIALYRLLLPKKFDMPDEPLIRVFVMDYYKMDKATLPYQEAAVYLLARYKQKPGWVCLTMPVTSDMARRGGIFFQGYPKIMGDVRINREPSKFTGIFSLKNKTVLEVEFIPGKDRSVSAEEEAWFRRFHGVGDFNILNGKVFEPQFGGKEFILDAARMYPDKLVIQTGKARITQFPEAARAHSERLAQIFGFQPAEPVLAYYIKNLFKMNFGVGSYPDRQ